MTGQDFKAIRMRFGASAREFLEYVLNKHQISRTETFLYQMEDRPNGEPMPERWVKYLREFMGADVFNTLVKELEPVKDGAK